MNRSENQWEMEIIMIALEIFNFFFSICQKFTSYKKKEYALLSNFEYWLFEDALSTSQMLFVIPKSCSEGQLSKSLEDLKTPKDFRKLDV